MSTDTTATPDAAWPNPNSVWRATVIAAINESLGAELTEESDPYAIASQIRVGIDNLRILRDAAVTERNNIRAHSNFCLDSERIYHQTIADRLGITYDTVKDAAALCDTLAPRLAVEADAVKAAANVGNVLPDALLLDDDGHLPTPARVIHLLAGDLRAARRATERANDALNNAKAEADALRASFATSQADLRASDRARDEFRDATRTLGRSLALAGSACADLAAIR
jgi:hypothetical protein